MLGATEWGIYVYIYGYNNAHDVIVYMVVKDMQSECGQPLHRFQKSPFWSVYTETQPRSFQTKTGSAAFSKVFIFEGRKCRSSVNDRRNCSKSYVF